MDSVVGNLERLTFDMSAAMEDLANYETLVLDSKASYDNMYRFIESWRDEIRAEVSRILKAKQDNNIVETVYNPIQPKEF